MEVKMKKVGKIIGSILLVLGGLAPVLWGLACFRDEPWTDVSLTEFSAALFVCTFGVASITVCPCIVAIIYLWSSKEEWKRRRGKFSLLTKTLFGLLVLTVVTLCVMLFIIVPIDDRRAADQRAAYAAEHSFNTDVDRFYDAIAKENDIFSASFWKVSGWRDVPTFHKVEKLEQEELEKFMTEVAAYEKELDELSQNFRKKAFAKQEEIYLIMSHLALAQKYEISLARLYVEQMRLDEIDKAYLISLVIALNEVRNAENSQFLALNMALLKRRQ
jgi:hypothetical protein